jgi:threonine dehydrogenase-like Zn-dependent dehydrogenase
MLETDVSETANEMIMSCRKMGRCGVISAYAGYTNHFNIGALMEKGIRFIGNGQAPVHLYRDELMEMLQDGRLDTKFLVSHRIDVSEFDQLYAAFDKRQAGLMKVFVQTRHSNPPAPGFPQLSSLKDLTTEVL